METRKVDLLELSDPERAILLKHAKSYLQQQKAEAKIAKWNNGKLHMDRRWKTILSALFIFVVGIMVAIDSFIQNIIIGYPIALAFALLGTTIFLVNSE